MARKPSLPGPEDFFGSKGGETASPARRKAVKPQNRETVEEPLAPVGPARDAPARTIEPGFTEKVTFYVPPEILKGLELTRVQLLLEHNLKVSRSQIVEVILGEMVGQVEHIADALASATEEGR